MSTFWRVVNAPLSVLHASAAELWVAAFGAWDPAESSQRAPAASATGPSAAGTGTRRRSPRDPQQQQQQPGGGARGARAKRRAETREELGSPNDEAAGQPPASHKRARGEGSEAGQARLRWAKVKTEPGLEQVPPSRRHVSRARYTPPAPRRSLSRMSAQEAGTSEQHPLVPEQGLAFSESLAYSTAGEHWSLHGARGFAPSHCGPDLFVADGGRALVNRGRGLPPQGALLADGSNTPPSEPCFFAAGSRGWFRLCSPAHQPLSVFLAFVAPPSLPALRGHLSFFNLSQQLPELPSPSRRGELLRWPTRLGPGCSTAEAEVAVDVLVDFRDPSNATVRLYAADIAADIAAGAGGGLVRRPYTQELLSLVLEDGAAGGGHLAILTHTKLSGFGQVGVRLTPPQHVQDVDLARML